MAIVSNKISDFAALGAKKVEQVSNAESGSNKITVGMQNLGESLANASTGTVNTAMLAARGPQDILDFTQRGQEALKEILATAPNKDIYDLFDEDGIMKLDIAKFHEILKEEENKYFDAKTIGQDGDAEYSYDSDGDGKFDVRITTNGDNYTVGYYENFESGTQATGFLEYDKDGNLLEIFKCIDDDSYNEWQNPENEDFYTSNHGIDDINDYDERYLDGHYTMKTYDDNGNVKYKYEQEGLPEGHELA